MDGPRLQKLIRLQQRKSVKLDVRSSSKRALLGVRSYRRERIRDHRNEEIDEPEIEHDDANYEEYTGDEELGVDHRVHDWRPLQYPTTG
jgi:hypothetical protein